MLVFLEIWNVSETGLEIDNVPDIGKDMLSVESNCFSAELDLGSSRGLPTSESTFANAAVYFRFSYDSPCFVNDIQRINYKRLI